MAQVVRMPRMSDTMEEGVIAAWHKKVGDKISAGDLLAEIETDKATMDFESPVEGMLLYIGPKQGEAIAIDGILAIVGEKDEDFQALLKDEKKPSGKKEKKIEKEKQTPNDEEVIEDFSEEEEVEVKKEKSKKEEKSTEEAAAIVETAGGRIKASPLARRLAKEKGVDLKKIKGSGDEGRIIRRDIERISAKKPLAQPAGEESFEDVPLTQMRKTIAKRLAKSKYSAPHYYLTIEVNMDKVIVARKDINDFASVKISFNDIIVKAAALALTAHPAVNASWEEDHIRKYKHVHMGIAVAVENGLLVPVIKFAAAKSLTQIAQESQELAALAREGKLKSEEMQGNTFTISNLGMFDIDEFTAIINTPASCILAVGRIKETPVVNAGKIGVSSLMKVTMSCDHRVVDGATGAKYLQTFKQLLEDPVRMLA